MNRVHIDVRAVGWTLMLTVFFLAVAHFGLARSEVAIFAVFDLNREGGFGTAFSVILGAFGSLLAFLAASRARRTGTSWLWWGLLGLGLLLYAIDEVAQIHEALSTIVSGELRESGSSIRGGTPIVGLFLLPAFLAAMWGTFRVAHRRPAWIIVSGLVLFWLAGFGIEEFEYLHSLGAFPLTERLSPDEGKFLLGGIQETFEMLGVALMTLGVLLHMALEGGRLEIEIS